MQGGEMKTTADITIFVGMNGSGKTRVIENVAAMCELAAPGMSLCLRGLPANGKGRMKAIFAALKAVEPQILIDDVDLHIDQEAMPKMIEQLLKSGKRIMCSAHNPLFLSHLPDDVAVAAVQYLYRIGRRYRWCKLFATPSMRKKLTVMNAGEAYADTDLAALGREIEELHIAVNQPDHRRGER